ncbi:MAG TPA: hypothetical protein VKB04_10985 [Anaerolineales bacterium]|nr:hypothetical protein [Anaerolineales bacterium]
MKGSVRAIQFSIALILSACAGLQKDHTGPAISDISTSDKVVVISDCLATSVTITAKVTDASNVKSVLLWVRVGSDQAFASSNMSLQNGIYTAKVKGADLQGHGYGAMEFYITAEDEDGNSSKSPVDNSIQFLPCVNN